MAGGTGDPESFVFQVAMRPQWGRKVSICRDDRDILQYFLRPAAQSLGIYRSGYGWHSLRRETVTALGALLGPDAAQRMAGHARPEMTLHYTLADHVREERAIRELQERISGKGDSNLQ